MSNTNRVRYGDQRIIPMPVESATVIEIGDFVIIQSNYLVPMTDLTDVGTAAQNVTAGEAAFVGLALSATKVGETDDVLVQTAGVVMLDQYLAAAIHIGDPIKLYAASTDLPPTNQTMQEGTGDTIAVCVKTHDNSTTETLCLLFPTVIMDDVAHS